MILYAVKRFSKTALFTNRARARAFAGSSDSKFGAFAWEQNGEAAGWCLVRWHGLDVDYGPVVHSLRMPDGSEAGIVHDRGAEPWTLLARAEWASDRKMPKWLENLRPAKA